MQIAWRRGFFRIWLLLVVLAVGGTAFDAYRDMHPVGCTTYAEPMAADEYWRLSHPEPATSAYQAASKQSPLPMSVDEWLQQNGIGPPPCTPIVRPWYQYVAMASFSPTLLLVIGVVVGWVFSGFKQTEVRLEQEGNSWSWSSLRPSWARIAIFLSRFQ